MSGVTIPWLWLLLAANVAFGAWGCLSDYDEKNYFPFGFFMLEGVMLLLWLAHQVLESVGAI